MALSNSPDYLKSENELRRSELEAKNALSAFFPTLDLESSHGIRKIEPDRAGVTSKTPAVSSASLIMKESLYDNGESYKKHRIAKLKLEQSRLRRDQLRAKTIQSVVLGYYRHNIAIENLNFTIKNFQEVERLSKLLSNQFYQGMKTKKDFLGFKTRAQRGRLDVLKAERAQLNARSELLAILGLAPESPTRFDTTIRPFVPVKIDAPKIKPEEMYESRLHELQAQIGRLEIGLAERKFWPEVNLLATASYGSSDYVDTNAGWTDQDATQWSVLLNVKFNLLDWGVRSRNIQMASLSQNTIEQGTRAKWLDSQKELEEFKKDVHVAQEQYRISKELQSMEEDSFKMIEREYRAGQATYLELVTGLANLLDAQARGQEADYQQAELYLKSKYYKGNLSEENLFK